MHALVEGGNVVNFRVYGKQCDASEASSQRPKIQHADQNACTPYLLLCSYCHLSVVPLEGVLVNLGGKGWWRDKLLGDGCASHEPQ